MSNPLPTSISPSKFNHLHLATISIADLHIPEREIRKHPPHQIRKIARSLEQFGWVSPIIVSSTNEVICGIARIKAAQSLGHEVAPAIQADHLTPEEIRAYRIADNRLEEDSSWDMNALKLEFEELLDLDFDLELTGFEVGEIDLILDLDEDPQAEDNIPAVAERTVTRPGDLWRLGEHLIYCGNALEAASYDTLLGEKQADAVFTDPPYNVPIGGNVCGSGKIQRAEFAMASGEMTDAEFGAFLDELHIHLVARSADHAAIYVCMDWRSVDRVVTSGRSAGLELINMCVWDKQKGGMGSFYRSQHELIAVFRQAGHMHRNNVQLGKFGRDRTNV